MTNYKFITASIFLVLSLCVYSHGQAQTSQTADQKLRAELLELQQSGKEGSLQVAAIFAKCHGFQSALYDRLTKDVILKVDEMKFAQQISTQSLEAGGTAFLFTASHSASPETTVNAISRATRGKWEPLLSKPGDIDELVWENLSYCMKLAPMSRYMIEEIEMHAAATK